MLPEFIHQRSYEFDGIRCFRLVFVAARFDASEVQKTLDHLRVARRNRDFARALLEQDGLTPAPWEWIVVIAFYAAVH
jgi:hypothetical protein